MNGRDLLKDLSHVDPALVEAAEFDDGHSRRRRPRPWLLAACVCLALVGTAYAVGTLWGVRIGELSTGKEKSNYSVYGTVRTVPDAEFSQEVHDALKDNWDAWWAKSEMERMISSTLPGSACRAYETWAEGADFLGVDLTNPLEEADWLEQATYVGMPLDSDHGREIGAEHCQVSFRGNAEGRVVTASLTSGYRCGNIRLTLRAEVQTEYAGEMTADGSQEAETGSVWAEAVDLASNSLVMADGQTAELVIAQPRREDSYVSIDAYFLQDGLLYSLCAVGPDGGDAAVDAVRAVLEQALDCFG